jgi:hypothetical protein
MVTTLSLIGLMHQSRINPVRNTPMRSNPPDLTILTRIKNLEYENPTVYTNERSYEIMCNL